MRLNKVDISGFDTSKLKTLSEQRKKELLRLSKNGDQKAREELIMGNLRLVLSIIQRFNPKGDSANDLFQVGCIGLIKSIDNFNLDIDVRFSTYAVSMIIVQRNAPNYLTGGLFGDMSGIKITSTNEAKSLTREAVIKKLIETEEFKSDKNTSLQALLTRKEGGYNRESVIDAVETFVIENGRGAEYRDFTSQNAMPSVKTVRKLFGMTLTAFLSEYFDGGRVKYLLTDGGKNYNTVKTFLTKSRMKLSGRERELADEMIEEYPLGQWNKKRIENNIYEFINLHNRLPVKRDFISDKSLPHPNIFKHIYSMTYAEFLRERFAQMYTPRGNKKKAYENKYAEKSSIETFAAEYRRICPSGMREYDRGRDKSIGSCAKTVMRRYNLETFAELVKLAGIKTERTGTAIKTVRYFVL